MRDNDLDALLREGGGSPPSPPEPGNEPTPRRPLRLAVLILFAVVAGLIALPVGLALSGDPMTALLGLALGGPVGFF